MLQDLLASLCLVVVLLALGVRVVPSTARWAPRRRRPATGSAAVRAEDEVDELAYRRP